MYCKNCGKEIKDGVRFCDNCGFEIGAAQSNENSKTGVPQNSAARYDVTDTLMWILTFTPILASVAAVILGIYGFVLTILVYVSNCLICYFDEKKLRECGYEELSGSASWFVPSYIYKRGKMLDRNNIGLAQTIIWSVLFFITFF